MRQSHWIFFTFENAELFLPLPHIHIDDTCSVCQNVEIAPIYDMAKSRNLKLHIIQSLIR